MPDDWCRNVKAPTTELLEFWSVAQPCLHVERSGGLTIDVSHTLSADLMSATGMHTSLKYAGQRVRGAVSATLNCIR